MSAPGQTVCGVLLVQCMADLSLRSLPHVGYQQQWQQVRWDPYWVARDAGRFPMRGEGGQ